MACMERPFSLKKTKMQGIKKTLRYILFVSVFLCSNLFCQNMENSSLLRFPVWFVLEEAPSQVSPLEQGDSVFFSATSAIRNLAPFFVEALVFGWEFSYTPSDVTRGVKEYFEVKKIVEISEDDTDFRFTDSFVRSDSSVIESWVEYDLTERMMYERLRWHTASYPTVGGKGSASVFEGIDSVRTACELSAKTAVREYARNIIKNKPKEITGKLLLIDFPRYYIDAGKYVADLDFFLNVSKIVEYTKF